MQLVDATDDIPFCGAVDHRQELVAAHAEEAARELPAHAPGEKRDQRPPAAVAVIVVGSLEVVEIGNYQGLRERPAPRASACWNR